MPSFDSLSPKTHKNAYSSIPNMHFSNENLGKTVISFRKVVANLQFTNNDQISNNDPFPNGLIFIKMIKLRKVICFWNAIEFRKAFSFGNMTGFWNVFSFRKVISCQKYRSRRKMSNFWNTKHKSAFSLFYFQINNFSGKIWGETLISFRKVVANIQANSHTFKKAYDISKFITFTKMIKK